jgi:SAM-dependent methyltransferase
VTDAAAEISDHRAKIHENAFLEEIYFDAYRRILEEVPPAEFPRLLEIGSGGGFLRELAPHVITSDCVAAAGIDRVADACKLDETFGAGALDAICALNVFHHLPDPVGFLRSSARVLRSGGKIVLVEPWFTPLGQWVWRLLHHEPVVLDPSFWGIVGAGRLDGANGRLPTSVFRDGDARFRREFPDLTIAKRQPFNKWLYVMSGGLTLNTRVPRPIAKRLVALDRKVRVGDRALGIFGLIVVRRT